MNRQKRGIRIIVLVVTIAWAVPAYTQVEAPVREAGGLDKIAWAGITLIDPDSAPTFLYGYNVEDLPDETLSRVFSENNAGRIRIAVITLADAQWRAEIPRDAQTTVTTLRASNQCTANNSGNCLVALARPLRRDLFHGAQEQEFVAQPNFWSLYSPSDE